jgi:hypothetical protein
MQRSLLLPLLVLLLPISSASADPIRIQEGSIVITPLSGFGFFEMNLPGRDGPRIHEIGGVESGFGVNCRPCEPGVRSDFGGFAPEDMGGVVQVGGRSFPISNNGNTVIVNMTAFAILPPPQATAVLSFPFDARISVNIRDEPLRQLVLIGRGTATVQLVEDGVGFWGWAGSRFDIERAPEPASLLLLGSGLACTIWTRRRARPGKGILQP